jgi:hypothetical protein
LLTVGLLNLGPQVTLEGLRLHADCYDDKIRYENFNNMDVHVGDESSRGISTRATNHRRSCGQREVTTQDIRAVMVKQKLRLPYASLAEQKRALLILVA